MQRVRAMVFAAPDFTLAGTFLVAWISPRLLGERAAWGLVLLMLLEFVILHASGLLGSIAYGHGSRGGKLLGLGTLGAVYMLVSGGLALAARAWWPLLTFWGLLGNHLLGVLLGRTPAGEEKKLIKSRWLAALALYLVFGMLTIVFPWVPALGTEGVVLWEDDPFKSGLWFDEPQRALSFGLLYFAGRGVLELWGAGRARQA